MTFTKVLGERSTAGYYDLVWPEAFPTALHDRYTPVQVLSERTILVRDAGGRKLVLKSHWRGDEETVDRWAAALSRLDDERPNAVAPVVEAVRSAEGYVVVSPFVEGDTLSQLLEETGSLPKRAWLDLAHGLACGLVALHENGVLHRDVKPENIIVRRDQAGNPCWARPCWIDLGFATVVREDTGLTNGGEIVGSPSYMSPEQIRAEPVGPAADVYALGVVLFEALHGRSPFTGDGVFAVLAQILSATTEFPQPANGFESFAHEWVRRCLAADGGQRPTADELRGVLGSDARRHVDDWESGARDPRVTTGAHGVVVPPAAGASSSTPGSSRPRVSIGLLVALAVVSALVLRIEDGASSSAVWLAYLLGAAAVFFGGMRFRQWLHEHAAPGRKRAEARAQRIVLGSDDPQAISQSIAIAVDDVVARCQGLDETVLALSMRALVQEHRLGETSSDRRAALIGLVELLEKVRHRVSPWYVRYEGQLGFVIKVSSAVGGVVGVLLAVAKVTQ